jgi:hypothetical protein
METKKELKKELKGEELKKGIPKVESEEGILGKVSLPNNLEREKKGGLNWH